MTGNLDAARLAYQSFIENDSEFLLSMNGSTRIVYLIDDVVYKVNIEENDIHNENECEIENAAALRPRLPRNVFIPEMTLHPVNDRINVLAMEYIGGQPTGECLDTFVGLACSHDIGECLDPIIIESLGAIGWNDPGYGNAIWSDASLWLVDVA